MTNLEHILAKALVQLVVSIDMTDDDDIDPDVATSLLEPVAALLQGVAEDDRRALVDLFAECAQDEPNLHRRMAADDLAGAFGLR